DQRKTIHVYCRLWLDTTGCDTPKDVPNLVHTLIPVFRLLGQKAPQQNYEPWWQITGNFRRIAEDGSHRVMRCLPAERILAGRHLTEKNPEGEYVGTVVQQVAGGLLGGHV